MNTRTVKIDPEEVDRLSYEVYEKAKAIPDSERREAAIAEAEKITNAALRRSKRTGIGYKYCLYIEKRKERCSPVMRRFMSVLYPWIPIVIFAAFAFLCAFLGAGIIILTASWFKSQ